jgi:hypothetical protein
MNVGADEVLLADVVTRALSHGIPWVHKGVVGLRHSGLPALHAQPLAHQITGGVLRSRLKDAMSASTSFGSNSR